jgi:hypothetical protein
MNNEKEEQSKKEPDLQWIKDIEEIDKISELPLDTEESLEEKRLRLINLFFDNQKESCVSHDWKVVFMYFINYSVQTQPIGQALIDAFRAGIIWGKYINELEEVPDK